MTTRTDELIAEIAELDAIIARDTEHIRVVTERIETDTRHVGLTRAYIAQVQKRKSNYETLLQREEARLVKPEGPCVTLESGGVEWKV